MNLYQQMREEKNQELNNLLPSQIQCNFRENVISEHSYISEKKIGKYRKSTDFSPSLYRKNVKIGENYYYIVVLECMIFV